MAVQPNQPNERDPPSDATVDPDGDYSNAITRGNDVSDSASHQFIDTEASPFQSGSTSDLPFDTQAIYWYVSAA